MRLVVTALTIAVMVSACTERPAPVAEQAVGGESDAAAFEAAVLATWETYSSTVNAGDVDGWIALWDDEGVQMPPNAPAVHGKPAIREAFGNVLQFVDFEEFTIENEEVQVFGALGFARGNYSFVNVMAEGGPAAFEGKYLTVFRRQPDGSWKVYRDCFNSNMPAPQ